MKLIPVIDIKGGQVVAAKRGDRCRYAPLDSPLCRSSRLPSVIDALLQLYPFDTLYIADLDAIAGLPGQLGQIADAAAASPTVSLWVDNGLQAQQRLQAIARPVIGSESLRSLDQLGEVLATAPDAILSLDYRGERFLGPEGLDRQPERWPDEVILMTLTRVGSGSGPDFERLRGVRRIIPERRLYAAGGVRDAADLVRLRDIGIDGALVSTALHRGAIPPSAIRALEGA